MITCQSAPMATGASAEPVPRPRLLDLLRNTARRQGHANVVIDTYARWVVRYVHFHGCRHPSALGVADIARFLDSVARADTAALRAIEEARNSLDFLYRQVLHQDMGELPRPRPPRLLDQVRQIMRVRHYSLRTEECYVQWITRFVVFPGKQHPRDLGALEIQQFLTDLAVRGHVAASTQNQALNALVFLYKQVLGTDLGRFDAVRATRPKRLPVVLAPEEVQRLLAKIEGVFLLMAQLLYGCGLRVMECCRLRTRTIENSLL